ncbi:conserved Plasmodium protein, unknown function [Plasmodium ovale curtisi]|uniref:Uncharacterized protein n=1 Tax=Plasmodium ovale curtisi TaxID=864141 RepID=A0A1A8W2I3_PLAOA|nr:conserved Plasmodium protein, unknown function [Plasmodium ovale curtisi]SBS97414.1 conserved Plasmodium protein, unknown function [Plasmodium ovale curtisi]
MRKRRHAGNVSKFERNLHYINNHILTNSKTKNKPTKQITSLYNHNEQTYLQKAQAGISHIRKNLGKGFGKGINSFAIAIIFLALTSVTGKLADRKIQDTHAYERCWPRPCINLLHIMHTMRTNACTEVCNVAESPTRKCNSSFLRLLYKNRWKEANTLSGNQKELFKYRCVKCNMVMFPAEGREQKFLKKSFICPNCGQSNMDKHLSKK